MKLWLVRKTWCGREERGDLFLTMIVAAKNLVEAKCMPVKYTAFALLMMKGMGNLRAANIIRVKWLGTAIPGTMAGVIHSSFHAV